MISTRRGRPPAALALLLPALLGAACLAPPEPRGLDREPGRAAQRALIESLFQTQDIRTARDAAGRADRSAVSAAWWGFDPEDATRSVQAALDAGAAFVLVPRLDAPWTCERLSVRSNTTLILEEGVVLLAKKGSFRKPGDDFLNITDADNVTIAGYGAVIRMRKNDYASPPYKRGEWRHTVTVRGSSRITLEGFTAESSGGDGVYLGRGRPRVTNTDIVLRDLILKDHHRQGVSVITATNLLIENTEMSGTSGTPPSAGIDFEPNRPDEPVINCRLRNCIIGRNAGPGLLMFFRRHQPSSAPFDIALENCEIFGSFTGAFVTGFENGARGRLSLNGCRIYGLKLIPPASAQFELQER